MPLVVITHFSSHRRHRRSACCATRSKVLQASGCHRAWPGNQRRCPYNCNVHQNWRRAAHRSHRPQVRVRADVQPWRVENVVAVSILKLTSEDRRFLEPSPADTRILRCNRNVTCRALRCLEAGATPPAPEQLRRISRATWRTRSPSFFSFFLSYRKRPFLTARAARTLTEVTYLKMKYKYKITDYPHPYGFKF